MNKMEDLYKSFILLGVISCISVCNCQSIDTAMKNVAGRMGEDVFLTTIFQKTAVDSSQAVKFEYIMPGDQTATSIWIETTPNAQLPKSYFKNMAVQDLGSNRFLYNLTITLPSSTVEAKNAAALYTASMPLQNLQSSARVMILKQVQCKSSASDVSQVTIVTLTCDSHFYTDMAVTSMEWMPTLGWMDHMNATLGSTRLTINKTTGVMMSQFDRTAQPGDHNMPFTCEVGVQKDPNVPAVANVDSQPPMYMDHCMTSFRVQYHSTRIVFIPAQPANGALDIEQGQHINCSADGNPTPTYTWICNRGQQFRQGQLLEITADLVSEQETICACRAMTTFGSQEKTFQSEFRLKAYKIGEEPGAVSEGSAGWVIAVAIIIPLIIIAVIVGIVLYCVKSKYFTRPPRKDPEYPPQPLPTAEPFSDMYSRNPPSNEDKIYKPSAGNNKPYKSGSVASLNRSNENLSGNRPVPNVRKSQENLNRDPNEPVYTKPIPKRRKSQDMISDGPGTGPIPSVRRSQEDLTKPPQNIRKSLEDITRSPQYGGPAGPASTAPGIRKSLENLANSPQSAPGKVSKHGGVPLPHMGPPPVAPKPQSRPKTMVEQEAPPPPSNLKQRQKSMESLV